MGVCSICVHVCVLYTCAEMLEVQQGRRKHYYLVLHCNLHRLLWVDTLSTHLVLCSERHLLPGNRSVVTALRDDAMLTDYSSRANIYKKSMGNQFNRT